MYRGSPRVYICWFWIAVYTHAKMEGREHFKLEAYRDTKLPEEAIPT